MGNVLSTDEEQQAHRTKRATSGPGGAQCPRCTEPATMVCETCKGIAYCSEECQCADLLSHKVMCEQFKDFALNKRPKENMRRIIIFHPDEGAPRFAWAPIKTSRLDDGSIEHQYVKTPTFETPYKEEEQSFMHNYWTDTPLGYKALINYDDEFFFNYPLPNRAVLKATLGQNAKVWNGPFIVHCGFVDPEFGNIVSVQDMDLRTYADLVAFFVNYFNDTPQHKLRKGPKLRAVKATWSTDREAGPAHKFSTVMIPRTHPIFSVVEAISPISMAVGMPLRVMKYPVLSNGEDLYTAGPLELSVASMHLSLNAERKGFGLPPREWAAPFGSVLINNASDERLSVEMINAFNDYCQFHVATYLNWANFKSGVQDSGKSAYRQKALEEVTPAKWATYLAQWKEAKGKSAKEADGGEAGGSAAGGPPHMAMNKADAKRLLDLLNKS